MALDTLRPVTDPWATVSHDEFRRRQELVRQAAAEQGFDGAIVWSRGGAFMDMSQDVLYLTGHYSQQPYMGDEAGIGTARSHGVCILPANGPVTVVVDIPWWRRDLVVADDVRPSIDVAGTTAEAIRDLGLEGRKLALVGASYMTAAAYLGMTSLQPTTQFVRADRLVEKFRAIKSPAEAQLIRQACHLGSLAMDDMMEAVVTGATEAEAAAEAARTLVRGGAVLYDAPCASGRNSHFFTSARLPSADPVRRMEKGDLFHVDFYGSYGGYFFDFARSRAIGDDPSKAQRDLLNAPIELVETICDAIRPGLTAGDLYSVGDAWLTESAVVAGLPKEEPEMDGFPALGHGIGMMWEAPWIMADDPTPIEPGMYLAIEILLGHPSTGGAMFEQNGLVTDTGFEVLTTARKRWW
ncbi:MAG TPA: Xaa-Pro peptidase family protein [Candidatus Dormibacteraeota bacterium]|nr:Xaa-Pro peptidase family protein [Candidatus Dormibacteraeota bacterium]